MQNRMRSDGSHRLRTPPTAKRAAGLLEIVEEIQDPLHMLACGTSTALNGRELRSEVLCSVTAHGKPVRTLVIASCIRNASKAVGVLQRKAMVTELFSAVP